MVEICISDGLSCGCCHRRISYFDPQLKPEMPHFISWQQFEDIKRQNYLNEAVKRFTFRAPSRAKEKIKVTPVAIAEPTEAKRYFKPDGYVRKTEICPRCKRRVKVVNGQMISHRFREGARDQWCTNNNE